MLYCEALISYFQVNFSKGRAPAVCTLVDRAWKFLAHWLGQHWDTAFKNSRQNDEGDTSFLMYIYFAQKHDIY